MARIMMHPNFNESQIAKGFENNLLSMPNAEKVGGSLMPFVLVADDTFALKPWLMKTYCDEEPSEYQRIYNYLHCRAHRTIENTFGNMSAKWRIFCGPIRAGLHTIAEPWWCADIR